MDHDPAADVCSPTWAEPSADGTRIFVTCNRAAEVLEIDATRWELVRRFSTGENPYNLGVTPDGRLLLVTLRNRTDPALEIYDLSTGRPSGRVPTTTTLAHGIAVSADSRYAFVSVEGVGSEPGKVDVIDLAAGRRVASVEVGQQATGIALVPPRR
jgi:DNA-binding beta-propeller fold protein YncE